MKKITSKDNECIKHIKKLKEKKDRDLYKEYIIEGLNLIEEAIKEKINIKQIIICEECENTNKIPKELMYEIAKYECICVTEKIFKYITEVKTPQGIMAIIEKNNDKEAINTNENIIIVLDDIQDPGNLGSIIRTLDSVGLKQILISKNTVDAYNPKVVRSTMGAILRVNIIECEDLETTIKKLKTQKYKVVVSSLQTENSIYDVNYEKNIIIVGNEANGVKKKLQDLADKKVKIPMLRKN